MKSISKIQVWGFLKKTKATFHGFWKIVGKLRPKQRWNRARTVNMQTNYRADGWESKC